MERGLTKQKIMEVMTFSPHGDLSQYRGICGPAAKQEPEFMAHFIAYLAEKSQVRDINLALPVITLAEPQFRDAELLGAPDEIRPDFGLNQNDGFRLDGRQCPDDATAPVNGIVNLADVRRQMAAQFRHAGRSCC